MSHFSQLYLTREEPIQDSDRFRNRIAASIGLFKLYENSYEIAQTIEVRLGATVPYQYQGRDLKKFFKTAEIGDVLSSITFIWEFLRNNAPRNANLWKKFIGDVFKEENLSYRIDEKAIVHYQVDEIFEQERAETLRWLSDQKFSAVKAAFEKSYTGLAEHSPNTKEAVRDIFEALEILIRLSDKSIKRLTANDATSFIKPKIETLYANDNVALDAASQILKSFCDWVNGVHLYRHGQAVTEPAPPPLGLAVLIVAQGTAYLRWLLEIYQLNVTN